MYYINIFKITKFFGFVRGNDRYLTGGCVVIVTLLSNIDWKRFIAVDS